MGSVSPENPDRLSKITEEPSSSTRQPKCQSSEETAVCLLKAVYLLYLWILCLDNHLRAIMPHIATFPRLGIDASCSANQSGESEVVWVCVRAEEC